MLKNSGSGEEDPGNAQRCGGNKRGRYIQQVGGHPGQVVLVREGPGRIPGH